MTVGSGISPNLLTLLVQALAGWRLRIHRTLITAGGESHPAPRTGDIDASTPDQGRRIAIPLSKTPEVVRAGEAALFSGRVMTSDSA